MYINSNYPSGNLITTEVVSGSRVIAVINIKILDRSHRLLKEENKNASDGACLQI